MASIVRRRSGCQEIVAGIFGKFDDLCQIEPVAVVDGIAIGRAVVVESQPAVDEDVESSDADRGMDSQLQIGGEL